MKRMRNFARAIAKVSQDFWPGLSEKQNFTKIVSTFAIRNYFALILGDINVCLRYFTYFL